MTRAVSTLAFITVFSAASFAHAGTISGTIKNAASGDPVSGVRLGLAVLREKIVTRFDDVAFDTVQRDGAPVEAVSAKNGDFKFANIAPGSYYLVSRDAVWALVDPGLPLGVVRKKTKLGTILVAPGARIHGTVFNEDYTQPMAGVPLELRIWDIYEAAEKGQPYLATTEADGSFELRGIAMGVYTLQLAPDCGFHMTSSVFLGFEVISSWAHSFNGIPLVWGQTLGPLEFTVEKLDEAERERRRSLRRVDAPDPANGVEGSSITLLVVDAKTLMPVERFSALLVDPIRTALPDGFHPDGTAIFPNCPAGKGSVECAAHGFDATKAIFEIEEGRDMELGVLLYSISGSRGSVLDANGYPFSKGDVSITHLDSGKAHERAQTDRYGEFVLPRAPTDKIRVAISQNDEEIFITDIDCGDGAPSPLVVRVGAGKTVFGRVLEGDTPVEHAEVAAFDLDALSPMMKTTADADGIYRLTGLPEGLNLLKLKVSTNKREREVEVEIHGTSVEQDFLLAPGNNNVEVHLLNKAGQYPTSVLLRLQTVTGEYMLLSGLLDSEGRTILQNVPAGSGALVVRCDEERAVLHVEIVDGGPKEIEVDWTRGVTVSGVLQTGEKRVSVRAYPGDLRGTKDLSDLMTNYAGMVTFKGDQEEDRFRFFHIPPGPMTIVGFNSYQSGSGTASAYARPVLFTKLIDVGHEDVSEIVLILNEE